MGNIGGRDLFLTEPNLCGVAASSGEGAKRAGGGLVLLTITHVSKPLHSRSYHLASIAAARARPGRTAIRQQPLPARTPAGTSSESSQFAEIHAYGRSRQNRLRRTCAQLVLNVQKQVRPEKMPDLHVGPAAFGSEA